MCQPAHCLIRAARLLHGTAPPTHAAQERNPSPQPSNPSTQRVDAVQKNIKQLILDDCGLDDAAFVELEPLIAMRGRHGLASLSLWHNSIPSEVRERWQQKLQGHDSMVNVDLPEAIVNQELAMPKRESADRERLDYPLG